MGIEILPPDVNLSDHEFMVVEGNIRFGLDAVKGVGYAAVEAIKTRARGRRAVHVAVGLLRARRRPRGQQARDRGADQVRRVRLHRRDAQGHARRCWSRRRPPGQQAQQDAQIGQGSIFDLGRRSAAAATAPTAGVRRAAAPADPDRGVRPPELLAMEKESIGLFISEHPLKRVREALRVKADCSLRRARRAQGRRLGEGRRHDHRRPRRSARAAGSTMMFATLDDLEGAVEIVVFEKALAAGEGALGDDAIVLVRGRVDHKEAGKVCVIVADVERVRAVATPRSRRPRRRRPKRRRRARAAAPAASTPRRLPATVIDDLSELFERYPGETSSCSRCTTRAGARRAALRRRPTGSRDAALRAELERILGPTRGRRA